MTKISMDLVKTLRDRTQVGMMACKKALEEASGDIEKAVVLLRKKGAAVAAKRSDNATDTAKTRLLRSAGCIAGGPTPDWRANEVWACGCTCASLPMTMTLGTHAPARP